MSQRDRRHRKAADADGVSPRNQLNELTATEWVRETVSVWRQKGLGAGHPDAQIEKQHPAPFSFTQSAQGTAQLLEFVHLVGEVLHPLRNLPRFVQQFSLGAPRARGRPRARGTQHSFDQTSRTFRATAMPIATKMSRISSFFKTGSPFAPTESAVGS